MIVDANKGKVAVDPLLDAPPSFEEAVASTSGVSALNNVATSSKGPLPEQAQGDQPFPRPGESPSIPNPPSPTSSPPAFSSWEAEYRVTSSGDIVSHDPHLNEDGEALYRFLLSQLNPPTFRLHCRGTHTEQHTRLVTTTVNGKIEQRSRTETETVVVVDFNFYIDLTELLTRAPGHEPEIWTTHDNVPAFRGEMFKQVLRGTNPELEESAADTHRSFWSRLTGRGRVELVDEETEGHIPYKWRPATRNEIKRSKEFLKERDEFGLPPWSPPMEYGREGSLHLTGMERSSDSPRPLGSDMTVRAWADDYCSSNKILKDFTFNKVVYGWNVATLKAAITDIIRSTNYTGTLSVEFETTGSKINIRPDTPLSRALSNIWLKFLLWLLLIYPFIWLFRRFHTQGGGRWEVCGSAYALKGTSPLDNTFGSSTSPQGRDGGMKEGQWLKAWQSTIVHGVTSRIQSQEPLWYRGTPATLLDGYND